ncbi:MAG TPA: alkaline phosphatase D family protein [Streptosporangiaceae bacterium]|nr:alkaline phosphatase D family protein [Streptosporangiaceae bacterium]
MSLSRRTFLGFSFAAAVTWSIGESVPAAAGAPDDVARLFAVRSRTAAAAQAAAAEFFPLSVGSGDPAADGIVLWTRVDPAVAGGRPQVAYEIAADEAFATPVVRGLTTAEAAHDWTVKVRIAEPAALRPGQTYFYRFIVAGTASRTGRFRTLPVGDVASVRFGYISCQDFGNGYYTALRHLADEDVDFIVHLGDYIYETTGDPSFQNNQVRTVKLPSGNTRAETLDDYRALYQIYRGDPDLQRLHERFAMVQIWDDHEFANDSYGAFDTDTTDEQANFAPDRKLAAVQAWAEYSMSGVPFDAGRGPINAVTIYRTLKVGNLLDLVLTDERSFRSRPPCGLDTLQRYLTTGCAERLSPDRTMLGAEQRAWFTDQITSSTATWKVWGNEVMCMQLKLINLYLQALFPTLPNLEVFLNLDQWDGFPAERTRILTAMRGVENFVAITGDLHSFGAGYLRPNFDNPLQQPVGVSLLGGSVTSSNFVEQISFGVGGRLVPPETELTWALRGSNPHLKYFNSAAHGYVIMEADHSGMRCTMKAVRSIRSTDADLLTLRVFGVPEGQVRLSTLDTGTREFGNASR